MRCLFPHHFLSEHVLYQHRNELHSANLVLENQATVDGLTGCINRRGMESRLNHLFHLHKQGNPDAPERISTLLFDIDFFKQYNDIPMSTTWVFVGLLCGRELAISTLMKDYKFKYVFPIVAKDFEKMMLGL